MQIDQAGMYIFAGNMFVAIKCMHGVMFYTGLISQRNVNVIIVSTTQSGQTSQQISKNCTAKHIFSIAYTDPAWVSIRRYISGPHLHVCPDLVLITLQVVRGGS